MLLKADSWAFDLDDRGVDHKPDVVCVAAPLVPTNDEETLQPLAVISQTAFAMRWISHVVLILGVTSIARTSTPNAR